MDWSALFNAHTIIAFLVGVVAVRVIGRVGEWLMGPGLSKAVAELEELRTRSNSTALGAQIQADDAVINCLEQALPDAVSTLNETMKTALSDGKLDAVDWKEIGTRVWAAAKPHIQGGTYDYLQHSSFKDGAAISQLVAKRFFTKKNDPALKGN